MLSCSFSSVMKKMQMKSCAGLGRLVMDLVVGDPPIESLEDAACAASA